MSTKCRRCNGAMPKDRIGEQQICPACIKSKKKRFIIEDEFGGYINPNVIRRFIMKINSIQQGEFW